MIAILAILLFIGNNFQKGLHGARNDFLVLEVLLEGNAAGQGRGELDVVRGIAAGVSSEVLFHNLSCDPTDAGDKAGENSGVSDSFDKLVVRQGRVNMKGRRKVQKKINLLCPPRPRRCPCDKPLRAKDRGRYEKLLR